MMHYAQVIDSYVIKADHWIVFWLLGEDERLSVALNGPIQLNITDLVELDEGEDGFLAKRIEASELPAGIEPFLDPEEGAPRRPDCLGAQVADITSIAAPASISVEDRNKLIIADRKVQLAY